MIAGRYLVEGGRVNLVYQQICSPFFPRAGKLRVHHYHIRRTESGGTNLSNGHSNGSAAPPSATNGGGGTTGSGGSGEVPAAPPQFYLSEKHAFPTISEVIHYHKHNSGGLVVRLRSPPVKDRESPVTAGMGLDEFELDPAELQIDNEPIGKGQFGVRCQHCCHHLGYFING